MKDQATIESRIDYKNWSSSIETHEWGWKIRRRVVLELVEKDGIIGWDVQRRGTRWAINEARRDGLRDMLKDSVNEETYKLELYLWVKVKLKSIISMIME